MPPVSKTCQSCANSKVRCVRSHDGASTCDRCHRLGRECLYRQTGRQFKGFHKDRKIAALESKINELTVKRAGLREGSDHSARSSIHSTSFLADGDAALEDIIGRDFLNIETAERYLSNFKARLTPHFPFVVVPPSVSVQQLRHEKPFLCLAILASASYENMPLQRALGHELKKVVASRMLVGGEVSFELLQGLLVFLAWSHYHSKPHRYTQFLQLAISLMIDLRLDRPPQSSEWKTALRFGPQDKVNLRNRTFSRPSWGSDEQRAVLGCYYLSSSIAMLLQKKSTILRLPCHDDCCKSLREANEYPQDRYINHMIQLQFIAEKIDQLSSKHELDLEKPGSGSELYLNHLKSELETFHRNISLEINESSKLRKAVGTLSKVLALTYGRKKAPLAMQYHATELCLYQLALNVTSQQPQLDLGSQSTWRHEMSVSALVSTSSILNLYIQLPPNEELGFNNTQWVQIGFALLVAYRYIETTSNPDQTTAFLHTLLKLQSRVEALSTADVDANGARDVFFDFRKRVVQIREWLERSDEQKDTSSHSQGQEIFHHRPSAGSAEFDRFMDIGAAEPYDVPLWSFSPSAQPSQIPLDELLFTAPFDQMMGDWI